MNKIDLEKFDPSGMHKVYDNWPKIAKEAYESGLKEIKFHGIDHIVFSGMGGSGAIGDLFVSILSKTNIHVTTVKGYLLPKTVDKNTLVVIISVSGNTQETLSTLQSSQNLDCKIISFSCGGEIIDFCQKNNILYRKIEAIHSPRASFVKFVYSILSVLKFILPIKEDDILSSLSELETIKQKISTNNLCPSNPSLELANWISGIPIIYYPYGLQSAAIRFKSSLQENSKIHVIAEDIIEACHNGIVAWEKKSKVQPILVRGRDDYIKTQERWEIIKNYFEKNNIDFKEVYSVEGNILSKIIVLIYIFDFASIYYAILNKIDPTPTKSIDFIKEKL